MTTQPGQRTKLFIVTAPSGAGKSSLLDQAFKDFPNLEDIITYTTRPMRPGESEGNPYHFVTREKFEQLKKEGFFIEHAVVHADYKGTARDSFDKAWASGKYLIMDVDVQGVNTFRKIFPNAVYIFIHPPSLDELRKRLEKRDAGRTKDLELRLKNATEEIKQAHTFEFQIVNDKFDKAYADFKKIIADVMKKG